MQYAKNWGANTSPSAANDPNTLTSLGIRQAYIVIRNLGVVGLSIKGGAATHRDGESALVRFV